MKVWVDAASNHVIGSEGDESFPTTHGLMCIKGMHAHEQIHHPDRLLHPLLRKNGSLAKTTWDELFTQTAEAFQKIQAKYGKEAVAVYGGGALTNEKAYLLGKFARVALQTPHMDYNGRYCMSSAAVAGQMAFGVDRGLPFPASDIPLADCLIIIGSNVFDTLPPLTAYLIDARNRGCRIIVVDPRRTQTAQMADVHLALRPSTDLALANGLLHLLIENGQIDEKFISDRTSGFDDVKKCVSKYDPATVAKITDLPEELIRKTAGLFGSAEKGMILTARGAEQQTKGADTVLAFINIVLATGKIGRPGCGYGALTGQGNGQGGREHGQKADQLPGYRKIDNPVHRKEICDVWGFPEEMLPGKGKSAQEIFHAIISGEIRGLLVMGSNPAVSAPNGNPINEALKKLDFLAVADFFPSETVEMAHAVMPSALFIEEEGTVTNFEGRVLYRRKILSSPGEVRTDIQILTALANALGARRFFDYSNTRDVFEEFRRATRGGIADYSGLTYERIDNERGIFWPCPTPDHPGTPRLFADRFFHSDGKARFHAVLHRDPPEMPSANFPLVLTTGRLLEHYLSGTQTHRIPALEKKQPEPYAEIHPAVARSHQIQDGEMIRLVSPRGTIVLRARISETIRADLVFVPFHWGGLQSINQLTSDAWDPRTKMPTFKHCAVRVEKI